MGSKNGKYNVENGTSLRNGKETVPTYISESNEQKLNKKSKRNTTIIPKCINRDILPDSLSTKTDTISLVWLDTDVYRRASNIDTEIKLKNLNSYIRLFDRVDSCERYIKQIGKLNNNANIKKEKLLIIISTTLAPTLIPHLHDLTQVKYIYIYGKSKTLSKAHQEWLRKYNKVKGVYSSSRPLIAQISQDQN
ncbi:unnamed protein product [Adineta steineri]|uniref:Uncharacterized protein n=1 Tax=Adineta steineri TaxID=433720 RepID=A0A814DTV2_9BILA|nr:unnamed protein product [Adineta steineri]CAF0998434.1 unnamed protein product [Adineta steineri]